MGGGTSVGSLLSSSLADSQLFMMTFRKKKKERKLARKSPNFKQNIQYQSWQTTIKADFYHAFILLCLRLKLGAWERYLCHTQHSHSSKMYNLYYPTLYARCLHTLWGSTQDQFLRGMGGGKSFSLSLQKQNLKHDKERDRQRNIIWNTTSFYPHYTLYLDVYLYPIVSSTTQLKHL